MADAVRCVGCGDLIEVSVCAACGARILAEVHHLDATNGERQRDELEGDELEGGGPGRDELDGELDEQDAASRARRDRLRAAADRARAADDRARAAADLEAATREREQALRLRRESVVSLRLATTDELTGARTRAAGLEEVSRELARAHRTGVGLVLAFVDVEGLKAVNDSRGHLAGDALLRLVGDSLRKNVRHYDVIVRYGGDEFVCAMPNIATGEAHARFERIAEALRRVDAEHSIRFGLAETRPADSLNELIARADASLLASRRPGG